MIYTVLLLCGLQVYIYCGSVRTVVYIILFPSRYMYIVHQDAGGYFYLSSFNGRGTHFQVLRYIIYGEKETISVK